MDGITNSIRKRSLTTNPKPEGLIRDYEREHTMSPAVSWFIWSIALPAACFAALALAIRDIYRATTPKRSLRTNLAIATVAILGAVVVFTYEKPEVPSTSFTQINTAVLATVKEGDLILCTDPASGQVMRAMLVRSVISDAHTTYNKIHGHFLDQKVFRETNTGIYPSYFNGCQVEILSDDGLGSVDQKIGKIIRLGLNPPLPSQ